jgi:polyisoprenoid-binding protein YceI
MQAPSGPLTARPLRALLTDGDLAGDWALGPGESSIWLKSRALLGLVPVTGVFREVSGSGAVAPDGRVSSAITVAAGSIDTRNARRDTHLRSADFPDSARYPDITFTLDGIRPSGQRVAVAGTLTASGSRCYAVSSPMR